MLKSSLGALFLTGVLVQLGAPASAQGRVLLVDAGGTTPYPTIQSAVNAAVAGDLVYVLDHPDPLGTYAGFTVTGLGITVMARPTTESRVGHAVVQNVPVGQSVALIGLTIVGPAGVQISGCTGPVHVAECTIEATATNGPALRVAGSTAVSVATTTARGYENVNGTEGTIAISSSSVELDRCTAIGRGGRHTPSFACALTPPFDGGPGVTVEGPSSTVRLLGGSYAGGQGGYGGSWAFCDGGGGSGLVVTGGATVFSRGTVITPGPSGAFSWPPVQGPLVQSSEPARDLDLAPVADADGGIDLAARGVPGDQAWLVLANGGGARPFGLEAGTLGLDLASLGPRIGLGTFGGNGQLTARVSLAPLGVNDTERRVVQLASHGPLGVRFSATKLVHLLGPSAPIAPEGAHLFVDPNAPALGNGRSWATAIADPEVALMRAVGNLFTGGEVWLREGEYLVGSDGVIVDDPVRMRPGTRLIGGFRGDEASVAERDLAGRWSVLTGDALGDDQPGFTGRSDNARRLLQVKIDRRHGPILIDRIWFRGAESPTLTLRNVVHIEAPGRIVGCRLTDSRTVGDLLAWQVAPRSLERCEVFGNSARTGASVGNGDVSILGCLFVANRFDTSAVAHYGGGFLMSQCTVAYNSLLMFGRAVDTHSNGLPNAVGRIENSILWNNARGGVRDFDAQFRSQPGHARFAHCCVMDWLGAYPATAVHRLDPRFRAPLGPDGSPGTLDDDFRLAVLSPCVDAGDTTLVPPELALDLDGRPRVADDPATPDTGSGGPPVVDMGAYER